MANAKPLIPLKPIEPLGGSIETPPLFQSPATPILEHTLPVVTPDERKRLSNSIFDSLHISHGQSPVGREQSPKSTAYSEQMNAYLMGVADAQQAMLDGQSRAPVMPKSPEEAEVQMILQGITEIFRFFGIFLGRGMSNLPDPGQSLSSMVNQPGVFDALRQFMGPMSSASVCGIGSKS